MTPLRISHYLRHSTFSEFVSLYLDYRFVRFLESGFWIFGFGGFTG